MLTLSLEELAQITQGELINANPDMQIQQICTDTRAVLDPNLAYIFIALKGVKYDAHEYITEYAHKFQALLVDQIIATSVPQIKVQNTLEALHALGNYIRRNVNLEQVIAITGSNGKTSCKEMLIKIFQEKYPAEEVLYTLANLNNQFGVGYLLCSLTPIHKVAIIELGTSSFGEIAASVKAVEPDISLLNNVNEAHLGELIDLAGVAKAKDEIFLHLKEQGVRVLNLDSNLLEQSFALQKEQSKLTFSVHNEQANVFATNIVREVGTVKWTLNYKVAEDLQQQEITMFDLIEDIHISNALAVSAVALAAKIDLASIARALAEYKTVKGRLYRQALANWTIIDDAYNANYASMLASFSLLSREDGEQYLVIGDIRDLGSHSERIHLELAQALAKFNFQNLIVYGTQVKIISDMLGCTYFSEEEYVELEAHVLKIFLANQQIKSSLLIKASNSLGLSRLVNALLSSSE